jgi:hypothetical protein
MAQAGGSRRLAFWAQDDEPGDVIVYCTDPDKAYLWALYVIRGPLPIKAAANGGAASRFSSAAATWARLH